MRNTIVFLPHGVMKTMPLNLIIEIIGWSLILFELFAGRKTADSVHDAISRHSWELFHALFLPKPGDSSFSVMGQGLLLGVFVWAILSFSSVKESEVWLLLKAQNAFIGTVMSHYDGTISERDIFIRGLPFFWILALLGILLALLLMLFSWLLRQHPGGVLGGLGVALALSSSLLARI